MENLAAANAVNEESSIIFDEYPEGPRNFFLYLEISDGHISPSLVQIYPDHLFWAVPWGVGDGFYELWQDTAADAKWYAVTLEIRGEKFELQFLYDMPEEFVEGNGDDEEDYDRSVERAMVAIHARFPDLPLRHPVDDPAAIERKMIKRIGGNVSSFDLSPSDVTRHDDD